MKMKGLCVILFLGNICGMLIFLKGFLMNRSEIYNINSLNHFTQKSVYKRIILLLVDALKYEFIDPLKSDNNSFHLGKLNVIQRLKKDKFIYVSQFYADPPTTTLQRLKGLMTGSLPTFIDMSNNFGGSEIQEDNLITQWLRHRFKIDFVGDDTWLQLFPNHFNRTESYPSFNVKDLDTVDAGVRAFVERSMQKKHGNDNMEVIIGHMLGVDHCGHTYGKQHPQMERKLIELNEFINNMTNRMDQETLLVVMGDHGMTNTGDHGGDSSDETDAGLLVVSSKPFLYHKSHTNLANYYGDVNRMDQVDLVPTLAALTSVPVPFSNLGVLNSDLMISEDMKAKYQLNNAEQLANFLREYKTKYGTLDLPESISAANQTVSSQSQTYSSSQLQYIKQHLHGKWAQFNEALIVSGLLLSVFCVATSVLGIGADGGGKLVVFTFTSAVVGVGVLSGCSVWMEGSVVCNIGLGVIVCARIIMSGKLLLENSISKLFIIVVFFVTLCVNFSNSFIVHEDVVMRYLLISLLFRRFLISCGLRLKQKLKHRKRQVKLYKRSIVLLILMMSLCVVMTHLGYMYKLHREEQMTGVSFSTASTSGSDYVYWPCILPLVMCVAVWAWLRGKADCALHSSVLLRLGVQYLLVASVVLMFMFHSIQMAVARGSSAALVRDHTAADPFILVVLPRLVLALLFFVLAVWLYTPVHIIKTTTTSRAPTSHDVTGIFNYLRQQQQHRHDKGPIVVFVQGLATPYSSCLLVCLLICALLGCLFIKLPFLLGVFCTMMILIGYSILYASSSEWQYNEGILSQFSMLEIGVFIQILSQYSFYATGHQATISNIPWYAAFIGYQGDHSTNILPFLMVLWNLFGVGTVALVTTGIMMPVMMVLLKNSSIVNKSVCCNDDNNEKDKDELRNSGEYLLFINDKMASRFSQFIWDLLSVYCTIQSCITLSSLLSCGLHRRHLMAWKIFVPKMLYSCIQLIISYCSAVLGYVLITRVHRCTVKWRAHNL